jgi:hypothetical protein
MPADKPHEGPEHPLLEWRRLRAERPCPTCRGSGVIPFPNMWGVTGCPNCGHHDGVQKSKYPGVAPEPRQTPSAQESPPK